MASFTDRAGRSWDVAITVDRLEPLRTKYQLDLGELATSTEKQDEFGRDLLRMAGVVHCLCEDQADKLGVSKEQFVKGFDHATIVGATNAFGEAMIDFFHGPKASKMAGTRLREAQEKIEEKTTAIVEQAIDNYLSKLFAGNSPAPPASIPAA